MVSRLGQPARRLKNRPLIFYTPLETKPLQVKALFRVRGGNAGLTCAKPGLAQIMNKWTNVKGRLSAQALQIGLSAIEMALSVLARLVFQALRSLNAVRCGQYAK